MSHLACCLWSHSRVNFPRQHSFLGKLQVKFQYLNIVQFSETDGHLLQSPTTNVTARLVGILGDQRCPTTAAQQGQFVPVLENVIVGLSTMDQINHLLLPNTAVEVLGHTLELTVDLDHRKPISLTEWVWILDLCHCYKSFEFGSPSFSLQG
jgi:hypothetical protein